MLDHCRGRHAIAVQWQDPAIAHFATRIIIQGHRVEIISVSVHSCPYSAGIWESRT